MNPGSHGSQNGEEQYSTFMKEISEINPAEDTVTLNGDSSKHPWQQCYDEKSGCYYHWNVLTNEVSWELPSGKSLSSQSENIKSLKTCKPPLLSQANERTVSSNLKSHSDRNITSKNRTKHTRALSALVGYTSTSDVSDSDDDGDDEDDHKKICQPIVASDSKCLSTSDSPDLTSSTILPMPASQAKEPVTKDIQSCSQEFFSKTKENGQTSSAADEVKDENRNSVKLVDCSSDSDESESENTVSFKIDENATFSGVFHWTKPPIPENDLIDDENIKNVKKESSRDIFKRAVEEQYGEVSAPAKKPKLINFVKSDEILDLNKVTEMTSKVLPNENVQDKKTEIGQQTEEESSACADFDDVEAALTRALEQHKNAQNEQKVAPISATIEDPSPSDKEPTEDEIVTSKTETILQKLNALNSQLQFVCKIYKMSVELQARFDDWKLKALDSKYFSKCVENCSVKLDALEKEVMPPAWTCHWDRNYKMYFFQNEGEKLCQWEFPGSKIEESHNFVSNPPIPKNAPTPEKPPLPLSPPPSEVPPPLPPSPTTPAPPPPLPPSPYSTSADSLVRSDLGMDMEIEPNSESPKTELSEEVDQASPTQLFDKNATFAQDTPLVSQESAEKAAVPAKRRKKIKLKDGLALKKKQMTSLVARWVKIKEENNL